MKNDQPIRINIDDREQKSVVVSYLRAQSQCQIEISRMSLGDYCVDDQVIVERKTLQNLVSAKHELGECRNTPQSSHINHFFTIVAFPTTQKTTNSYR